MGYAELQIVHLCLFCFLCSVLDCVSPHVTGEVHLPVTAVRVPVRTRTPTNLRMDLIMPQRILRQTRKALAPLHHHHHHRAHHQGHHHHLLQMMKLQHLQLKTEMRTNIPGCMILVAGGNLRTI